MDLASMRIIVAVIIFLFSTLTFAANTNLPRAIWIWEQDAYRMLNSDKAALQVENFLAHHHIDTLYIYADEYNGRNILVNEPARYRTFIANAHARGFKVYALLGSYYLHTESYILPEKRQAALRMFANVLDYNKNADTTSQFDGMNIDIEPYLLDDWKPKRHLRGKQYLELSAAFMRMKADYQSKMHIGVAIPFWYDGIEDVTWKNKRRPLNEFVQDIYDYVALMDYRNIALGSDSIVSLAQEELDYGDKIGKKVMIGIETLKTTPAKLTFYGKSFAYFNQQLALAQSALLHHPSFGGFVIHHLESYQTLVNK